MVKNDSPVFSSGTSELDRAGGLSESLPEPNLTTTQKQPYQNPQLPTGNEYGPDNPRIDPTG